jgi:hypothetical protein
MTATAPWYDTLDGIKTALERDLAGFIELIRARRDAGYDRREQLHAWVVAYRFYLDGCGNACTLETPATDLGFVDGSGKWKGTASFSPIATHTATCVRCGRAWTLRDAHDYAATRDGDGNTLHYHAGCHRYMVSNRARVELTEIARNAGIEQELLDVPNLYGSERYAGPWLTVVTEKLGRVTLGWRRRVIAIEWERGPDGCEVFASESVTVDSKLVHAWNPEQATSYLRRLTEASC